MANVYIAKDDERLDQIIAKHYGDVENAREVLEANQHLVGKLVLGSGDKVFLPKIKEPVKTEAGKALW